MQSVVRSGSITCSQHLIMPSISTSTFWPKILEKDKKFTIQIGLKLLESGSGRFRKFSPRQALYLVTGIFLCLITERYDQGHFQSQFLLPKQLFKCSNLQQCDHEEFHLRWQCGLPVTFTLEKFLPSFPILHSLLNGTPSYLLTFCLQNISHSVNCKYVRENLSIYFI